jgi:hypothetical protein
MNRSMSASVHEAPRLQTVAVREGSLSNFDHSGCPDTAHECYSHCEKICDERGVARRTARSTDRAGCPGRYPPRLASGEEVCR